MITNACFIVLTCIAYGTTPSNNRCFIDTSEIAILFADEKRNETYVNLKYGQVKVKEPIEEVIRLKNECEQR